MVCRLEELRNKEVININNGNCLGTVDDVEINTKTAVVVCIVIYGRCKFFGLFGREDDIIIPWKEIRVIGEDAILVCIDQINCCTKRHIKKKNRFFRLFS